MNNIDNKATSGHNCAKELMSVLSNGDGNGECYADGFVEMSRILSMQHDF